MKSRVGAGRSPIPADKSATLSTGAPAGPSEGRDRRGAKANTPGLGSERRLVAALIALTLFASSLPYLLGYFITPPGAYFVGTVYNIDDYCNYLSWLRQMADGRFFLHNMFTTDPQKDLEFNVFFWLLGRVVALTHCSPQMALQLARVGGGLGLLALIYRFYRHCLPADRDARLAAFGFACLSSGWGWTQWRHWQDKNLPGTAVDAWQPEAYTFLTLYTSALMTVSTLLILGALYALLRGEQTGKWKYPLIAGVCGGILGNMHSYDVLHVAAAWGLFLVVLTILRRGRGVALSWARGIAALALTLPTTGYMVYLLKTEPVFRERAAVPTLAPLFPLMIRSHLFRVPILPYVLGYGVVFLLAALAVALLVRGKESPTPGAALATRRASADPSPLRGEGKESVLKAGPPVPLLFALCWAVAGLAVCYLPFTFQRKMLMGEHLPLCLLAGVGAAWLVRRFAPPAASVRAGALALLVAFSALSNGFFLARDFKHLEFNRSETHLAPFISNSLVDVYHWFRVNTPPDAAVVGFPGLCTLLPGEAGRAVWAGHWAETPSYARKDAEFADAFDRQTPDDERHSFLLSTRAQYLFYPNDVSTATFKRHGAVHQFVELTQAPPAYLREVYKNDTFTVYAIR